jgi:hypothetical protein
LDAVSCFKMKRSRWGQEQLTWARSKTTVWHPSHPLLRFAPTQAVLLRNERVIEPLPRSSCINRACPCVTLGQARNAAVCHKRMVVPGTRSAAYVHRESIVMLVDDSCFPACRDWTGLMTQQRAGRLQAPPGSIMLLTATQALRSPSASTARVLQDVRAQV